MEERPWSCGRSFSTMGFRFVDREQDADLLMLVNANTRVGGAPTALPTAHLDISFSFKRPPQPRGDYEGGRQGVKGVQPTSPRPA